MTNLTRGGVAYNLNDSPFRTTIKYQHEILTFVFSSNYIANKFINKISSNREKLKETLTKKYNIEITNDILADITLYMKTEKRGFLIIGRDAYTCQNNIKLDGGNLM